MFKIKYNLIINQFNMYYQNLMHISISFCLIGCEQHTTLPFSLVRVSRSAHTVVGPRRLWIIWIMRGRLKRISRLNYWVRPHFLLVGCGSACSPCIAILRSLRIYYTKPWHCKLNYYFLLYNIYIYKVYILLLNFLKHQINDKYYVDYVNCIIFVNYMIFCKFTIIIIMLTIFFIFFIIYQ